MLVFPVSVLATATVHAGLLATDGAGPVETEHVELNGSYSIDKVKSGPLISRIASTDGDITITAGSAQGLLIGDKFEFIKQIEGYAGVKFRLNKPETDITALFGVVLKFCPSS